MDFFDTIAAVSTPRGKGGVAVIRISGPDALAVGDAVFSKKLSETEPNKMVHGKIFLPLPDGKRKPIDDGLAVVFRAPFSFTGEDTVEINCHGGALVTATVLDACLAAGARQALAGEFTRRAFVNGKMGLDSAESLGALLEAKTLNQLTLARAGMDGRVGREAGRIYDSLMNVCAELRADIDFPDEDVSEMTSEQLKDAITEALGATRKLAGTYIAGRAVAEGVKTVICGKTNSGKSSLYNQLVGRDAAIVTDIEGTTRDLLEETVSCGGVTLRLCDTAGIRETSDTVEKIGVERAENAISESELVLAVFDGSRKTTPEDLDFINYLKKIDGKTIIAVINKSDLPLSDLADTVSAAFENVVTLSALNGVGLSDLEKIIADKFFGGEISEDQATLVTERQYGSVVRAAEFLRTASDGLSKGLPFDLISSDIESAMTELAGTDGRFVKEDIIDNIFSKFCVGK